ncbi:hypothetical protein D3C76_1597020 [compost metagenome]
MLQYNALGVLHNPLAQVLRLTGGYPAKCSLVVKRQYDAGANRFPGGRVAHECMKGVFPKQGLGQLQILLTKPVAKALSLLGPPQALMYLIHVNGFCRTIALRVGLFNFRPNFPACLFQ